MPVSLVEIGDVFFSSFQWCCVVCGWWRGMLRGTGTGACREGYVRCLLNNNNFLHLATHFSGLYFLIFVLCIHVRALGAAYAGECATRWHTRVRNALLFCFRVGGDDFMLYMQGDERGTVSAESGNEDENEDDKQDRGEYKALIGSGMKLFFTIWVEEQSTS